MISLKKAWNLWSDIITLAWVERLMVRYPKVAEPAGYTLLFVGLIVIACAAFSASMGDLNHFSWILSARLILEGTFFAALAVVMAYVPIKHFWNALAARRTKSKLQP